MSTPPERIPPPPPPVDWRTIPPPPQPQRPPPPPVVQQPPGDIFEKTAAVFSLISTLAALFLMGLFLYFLFGSGIL